MELDETFHSGFRFRVPLQCVFLTAVVDIVTVGICGDENVHNAEG
jgi:hypothetical protein